jgi:tetratricopeptide (TPR) repeat protein
MDSLETPPATMIESELSRIRAFFKQQKFPEMLAAAESLLDHSPDQREALLLFAMAQRYLERIPEALATLAKLERGHPRFSRLFQERGHCFVAMKRAPQAIEAFLTAVNINVALPASWRMLEGLYRMTGEADNAAMAASHVATLQKLPSEVVTATGLFADGDLEPAEALARAYLLKHGDHVEAMRLLARIGVARGVLDDAEVLLAGVLELAPRYTAARLDYVGVLIQRHKYREARRELDLLLGDDRQNRRYKTLLATSLVGLGEHEKAVALYRELLVDSPGDADLHLSIAHALKTLGRSQEAIDSYRLAAATRPHFGDAYWSLANLKTYRFTDEELTRLRAAEAAPLTAREDRIHLSFALGKALEDQEEYAESFRYYEIGNALKRADSKYRAEIIETNTRQQIAVCTADFFADRRNAGAQNPDPIFIVGLPRAGSTLIEQILASHSAVEGTQELADIQRVVLRLQGRDADLNDPRYPRILASMTDAEFHALGARYLADTSIYRTAKPHFIDKMPNNCRHIGLIHLMLPRAKIIDARRAPMACCFSNFKQLFASGQEFTYSIDDIARYYRTYLELMRHWDHALPGRILRVHHEDLVEDLDGSVRRILHYCGLTFEPACVEFHKTQRSVRTASSEQVRLPIFRESLDQWQHFEPWLGPLREALGDALERYRD